MTLPKYFKDFGKAARDLLNKKEDYDFKRPTVEVKVSHANPKANITAKLESEDGAVNMELKDKVVCGKYGTLTVKLPTEGDLSLEFENKNGLADNLDLITKLQWNQSVKLTAKYRNSTVAAAVDIEQKNLSGGANSESIITPSLVLGPFVDSRLSLGASAKLVPFAQKDTVTAYDVGAEYRTSDVTATAKVTDKASKLALGLSYQVDADRLFGVEYGFNPSNQKQSTMTVGGRYHFTPTSSLQAKVAQTGQVNTIFTQKVNDQVKLALSSRFNAANLEKSNQVLGIKLVLGDI